MKLIVQPEEGAAPLLAAIARARATIDVTVFRLDMRDVVRALAAAVQRGVTVRALIAHTNKGGDKGLRKLERDLLDAGAIVSRTADDLVRYHGKMMIIDGRSAHIYGFNFTRLDVNKSRSFGVVTTSRPLVQQAKRLFDADFARQPYTTDHPRIAVSPVNARTRLAAFIAGARKQLLLYDVNISDRRMVALLRERQKRGVEIRIIGKITGESGALCEKHPGKRLHVRCIIRDGSRAFVGSQSLRSLELDRRREIGVFISEAPVVKQMAEVFEKDWAETDAGRAAAALLEAHATATEAAGATKEAAKKAAVLSERSEKDAQRALEQAAKLAAEAKEAARNAKKAARELADVASVSELLSAAEEARAAAEDAEQAVESVAVRA